MEAARCWWGWGVDSRDGCSDGGVDGGYINDDDDGADDGGGAVVVMSL